MVNDITREDSGFGVDTNKVSIINRKEEIVDLPLMTKYEVAEYLCGILVSYFEQQSKGLTV